MMMVCSGCKKEEDFSPLRLGHVCGKCHSGKWVPVGFKAQTKVKSLEKDLKE